MSPKETIAALGVFGIAALLVTAGVFVTAPGVFGMFTGPSEQAQADTSLTVVDAGCESTLTQESSFKTNQTFEKTGILYRDSETRNLSTETTHTDRETMTAFNVTVSATDANTSTSSDSPCGSDERWGVVYNLSVDVPDVDNAAVAVIHNGNVSGCGVWTGDLPSYCEPKPSAAY
ncbi:hypothetical protein ELS19_20000 [Halogeometricum borinquense]|uniref:Uncharacterized protein n=1 Tax=Halogeometricum borinquense TaxID=60847 RepID=A0A482SWU1_9EURY|nr:hypothetical protein [Halogeometricum borinquense]RYJ07718.1 hypothetical protein ELS19_20000 [Halogeometricum borinquense]